MILRRLTAAALLAGVAGATVAAYQAAAQSPLSRAIDQLVSFDFATRTEAARTVRRAAAADVVPALAEAALSHKDGYVRYRALVLLAGYGDTSAGATMRKLIADPNDRIRAVTYGWFEHHPAKEIIPALIAALDTEQSEFVRPALTRALAASHTDTAARKALEPFIMRGEDYFRGSVIEALGDYQADWAREAISSVAMLAGPLQDDAIVALGKIGSRDSLSVLATLQRSARPETQPSLSAASCLITKECGPNLDYLTRTVAYAAADAERQALLRGAAFALGALARRGDKAALAALLNAGEPAKDPARAAIALAVGNVALRNASVVLDVLENHKTLDQAATLLLDAFDMLSEDFEEERFFVEIRRAYWAAPEGSARRRVAQTLIEKLEF